MRPSSSYHNLRTVQPGTAANRSRRRSDLTIPLPHRDFSSIALPLPLPLPSSAPGALQTAPAPPSAGASAPAHPLPPPITELERVKRIGSGAGGTVYLVRHRPTDRLYALKVIYGNLDDAVRHKIRREVEILLTTDSPFVVRCHGIYEQGGEIQVLLEYMDGGSLEGRRIASEQELSHVARQILTGLAYLHRRHIVHRDIKPSNLLIDSSRHIKIADFGVGRILSQSMDPVNSSVGTVAYMSPERINTDINDGAYNAFASDIWSFGLSILEFYLGRFPYGENVGRQGDWASLMCAICYADPPEAPQSASPEFRSFIRCCLQTNPTNRRTALQLLQHPFITQYMPPPLPLPPSAS